MTEMAKQFVLICLGDMFVNVENMNHETMYASLDCSLYENLLNKEETDCRQDGNAALVNSPLLEMGRNVMRKQR